jgi:sterol desaturase/sphingolipid hydroxylase (fatty acid hydroxylase superfamily)
MRPSFSKGSIEMRQGIIEFFAAFALLAGFFWIVERIWPGVPGQKWRRDGVGTDLSYWFFTSVVTKWMARAAVIVAALLIFAAIGRSPYNAPRNGFGPIATQPGWLQAIEIITIGDLIAYVMHRAFHGRRLWAFHSIHHSPKEVDWLSATRSHPVNDVLTRLVQSLPLFLLGFSPLVLAGYIPLFTFYTIMVHANVSWTFGPFKYVLASPVFHRWHHTKENEALNKNFAGLLPIWDIIFGTFYMPIGKLPTDFGTTDSIPPGIAAQLIHPFRAKQAAAMTGEGASPQSVSPDRIDPASAREFIGLANTNGTGPTRPVTSCQP